MFFRTNGGRGASSATGGKPKVHYVATSHRATELACSHDQLDALLLPPCDECAASNWNYMILFVCRTACTRRAVVFEQHRHQYHIASIYHRALAAEAPVINSQDGPVH